MIQVAFTTMTNGVSRRKQRKVTFCFSIAPQSGVPDFHETPQVIALQLGGVHSVEVVGSEIVEVHAVTALTAGPQEQPRHASK